MTDEVIPSAPTLPPEALNAIVDLETAGRQPYCPILTIGVAVVHMGEIPDGTNIIADVFYQAITLRSCLELGMKIDADTMLWWMGFQDSSPHPDAREAAFNDPNAVALPLALDAFTTWVNSRPLKLWGNSARFDLGILEAAYMVCGKEVPWSFRNERDYRSFNALPVSKQIDTPRYGVFHNALDDAITQGVHLREINKALQLQL